MSVRVRIVPIVESVKIKTVGVALLQELQDKPLCLTVLECVEIAEIVGRALTIHDYYDFKTEGTKTYEHRSLESV